jgi:hypothetical protein
MDVIFFFFRVYYDRAHLHITEHILWAASIDGMLSHLAHHVK